MQEKGFSSHNSYSLSKLAMMMYTFDLSEIMKPRGVTVNCLDPGTVNTKMLIAGQPGAGHYKRCKGTYGHAYAVFLTHPVSPSINRLHANC